MMSAMASSSDAGAQQAAMRSLLSTDEWLDFAEAAFDDEIVDVNGATLGLSLGEGEVTNWAETDTQTLSVQPFVITTGRLTFECGRWRSEIRRGVSLFETRPLPDGSAWEALPSDINAENYEESQRYWVGMATDPGETEIEIHAEIQAACEPCAGVEEIDSCLVGSWRMSGGGPVEWMRANLPPGVSIPSFNDSDGVVTYRADGSYFTAPYSYTMTMLAEGHDGITRAEGGGAVASAGTWSAEGGELHQCTAAQSMGGSVTVTPPRGPSGTMPFAAPGGGPVTWTYSCSRMSMQTTMDFPGMGAMNTQFERISEPPPE